MADVLPLPALPRVLASEDRRGVGGSVSELSTLRRSRLARSPAARRDGGTVLVPEARLQDAGEASAPRELAERRDGRREPPRRLVEVWPSANVGILTGRRSNLVVLDVDPRHGGDLAFQD